MLMAVKNQIKVTLKSIKYALMKEMLNKVTFITNIVFMILNNSCFIMQWLILYKLKGDVGGYTFNQILLLWGIAAGTYGFSHFFFQKAFSLSDTITNGKLDAFLIQPKNVLLSAITSSVETSAIGDMIYGLILLCISGFTISKLALFILFMITGGIIIVDFAVIGASLSFWIGKADFIADTLNGLVTNFDTYPDGIFKGISKAILLFILPVGVTSYIPVWVISEFDLRLTIVVILVTIFLTLLTFFIFNRGLKRYTSTNLMISKI